MTVGPPITFHGESSKCSTASRNSAEPEGADLALGLLQSAGMPHSSPSLSARESLMAAFVVLVLALLVALLGFAS